MKKTNPHRELFQRSIRRVLLVHRTDSPAAEALALDVAHWLKDRKIQVYSHPQQKLGRGAQPLKASHLAKMDLVLVLGGDGTYLEAVRLLHGAPVPVLGVNLGSLGFLTVFRAEDIYHALELTLHGKMQVRHRVVIEVDVRRAGKSRKTALALNDVVIERGSLSRLLNMSILVDRQLTGSVKADGLIVATPTGSTAYNLAAGGPILHPEVNALVITPICPHSLTNRPVLVSDRHELTFKLLVKNQKAFLSVDGRKITDLTSQDEIRIVRTTQDHLALRKPTDNYFSLLREKLKFGERA